MVVVAVKQPQVPIKIHLKSIIAADNFTSWFMCHFCAETFTRKLLALCIVIFREN